MTFAGAAASFFCGLAISTIYVIDALLPEASARQIFPLLHYPITQNYTYRGCWGTLVVTVVLFAVSAFTKRTDPAKLELTTIHWGGKLEPFQGLADWRLHMGVLGAMTAAAYWWLW